VREADKILVLKEGRVVEMGSHGELVKLPKGVYRSLYELQTGFTAQ
jgi:ABC-type multidrug transport system fused ATPase/permease subunit